jgi:hypothetical protein
MKLIAIHDLTVNGLVVPAGQPFATDTALGAALIKAGAAKKADAK